MLIQELRDRLVLDAQGHAVGPTINREAWKPIRGPRLGSSDAPAIFGKDEFVGAWEVWDRIVLGEWSDTTSADARRGNRQEPNALACFTEETGLGVDPLGMVRHAEHDLLVSDIDGVIHAPDEWPDVIAANPLWDAIRAIGGMGAAEVKVPRTAKFFRYRDEGVGVRHVIQMQHHLEVTGLQWGVFIVYDPMFDQVLLVPVLRDDDWCQIHRAGLLRWHRDHVATRQRPTRPAPEPKRWPKPVPGIATMLDNDEWMEATELLAIRHYELVDAQEQYAQTEAALLELVPDDAQHVAGGGVVVKKRSTTSQRRRDDSAVRAAIKLLQQEQDADALLAFDPDDEGFYYRTQSSEKVDVLVTAPNPMEVMA